MGDVVHYAVTEHVAVITIDRPDRRNAIDPAVAAGLTAALRRLEEDDLARVAVLTGAAGTFCAGADLAVVADGRARELFTEEGGFAGFVTYERSKVVIAAVEGSALAGGMEIVLACDLVVAADDARFGIPEVRRSLLAIAGALFRLPRLLPRNIAMELCVVGSEITAPRAHDLGLVNRLAAPGQALTQAVELAQEIARNGPIAVRESRRLLLELQGASDAAGFAACSEAAASIIRTNDFREGPIAFLEKRAPRWTGT